MNDRIRNGEFSERRLAAVLKVSQPQLHNVLKGARKLQTPLADAFLDQFNLSIVDLLTGVERLSTGKLATDSALLDDSGRLLRLPKQPPSSSSPSSGAKREAS